MTMNVQLKQSSKHCPYMHIKKRLWVLGCSTFYWLSVLFLWQWLYYMLALMNNLSSSCTDIPDSYDSWVATCTSLKKFNDEATRPPRGDLNAYICSYANQPKPKSETQKNRIHCIKNWSTLTTSFHHQRPNFISASASLSICSQSFISSWSPFVIVILTISNPLAYAGECDELDASASAKCVN